MPSFEFAARLIADVLIWIGEGSSYRDTGEKLRKADRRFIEIDELGITYASREGTHVARYLDLFGDAIVAAVAHTSWPRIVLLDAKPLRTRVYGKGGGVEAIESSGAFLAASGYTRPSRFYRDENGEVHLDRAKPHLWHVEFAGGEDAESWYDFLTHLEGDVEWVVCDDSDAIKNAARRRWPNAVIYSCEGHLLKLYEKAAAKDHLTPNQAEALWGEALRNPDEWRAFLDRVLALPPDQSKQIAGFIGRNYALIESQWALRKPGFQRGNGAMEASFSKLYGWLEQRIKTFQNVHRLNVVLGLMRAQIAGHADPALYARVIETELRTLRAKGTTKWGNPAINWETGIIKGGAKGVFEAADAAQGRWLKNQPDYMAAAKVSSVERKAIVANAYHASIGIAPLVFIPSARSARVETTGKMLTEFPLIYREWDRERNRGLDPDQEIAGTYKSRHWRCHRNPEHRWTATTKERCARLNGCRQCDQEARKGHKTGRAAPKPVAQIAAELDELLEEVPIFDEDHDFTSDPDYFSKTLSDEEFSASIEADLERFPEDVFGVIDPPDDEPF